MNATVDIAVGGSATTFGALIRNVNEFRATDDDTEERLVAGEHIDEERVVVDRWALTTDEVVPPTFNRRFRAGHTLLHSRNPDKLARATFAGITGEKLFVLEPISDQVLDQHLILHLLRTEAFRSFLRGALRGSVNTFLNWGQLSQWQVELPSIQRQREIAAVLDAVDAVAERWRLVGQHVDRFLAALVRERLTEYSAPVVSLGDLLTEVKYGTSKKSIADEGAGVPVLRIPNVVSREVDLRDLKYADLPADELAKVRLRRGDLLLIRTNGNPEYVGRCAWLREDPETEMAFASYLLRLRLDETRVRPGYLWLLLSHPAMRAAMRPLIRSSAGNHNLSAPGLKKLPIPLPGLDQQDALVSAAEEVRSAGRLAEGRVATTEVLGNRLREGFLG